MHNSNLSGFLHFPLSICRGEPPFPFPPFSHYIPCRLSPPSLNCEGESEYMKRDKMATFGKTNGRTEKGKGGERSVQ